MEHNAILQLLWKVSWQTGVLAVVVWVITRCARKAPASWRHALWLIVLVKLFVPPFAHFPAELVFWTTAGTAAMTQVTEAPSVPAVRGLEAAPLDPKLPVEQKQFNYGMRPSPNTVSSSPGTDWQFSSNSQPSAYHLWHYLPTGLVIIWLSGLAAMLLLLLVRRMRQSRLLRCSTDPDERSTNLTAESAACLGIRRLPNIRFLSEARTPTLAGVLRPTILLPPEVVGSCSNEQLKAMILHEMAHIKRRDMWILWLQQLAQVLFFFHPAVWFAGREIRRERELACDELVLSKSSIRRKDYAAGYLSALKMASSSSVISGSLAMAEPFEVEKRRLDMILKNAIPKMSWWWVIGLFAAVLIGLPTFIGLTNAAPSPADIAASLRDQEKASGSSLTVDYVDGEYKMHYVRTAEALFLQSVFHDSVHRESLDRNTGEYRSWVDRKEYAVSHKYRSSFAMQDLPETARYQLGGVSLPDMIERGVTSSKQERIDGYLCWRIEIPGSSKYVSRYIVWVDPVIGYCPRRVETLYMSPSKRHVAQFRGYREISQGIWFPSDLIIDAVYPGQKAHKTIRVSGARVGQVQPKSSLLIEFPEGATVYDKDSRVRFLWPSRPHTEAAKAPEDTRWTIPLHPTGTEPRVTITLKASRDKVDKVGVEPVLLSGLTPVEGPGLVVILKDSNQRPSETSPEDLYHFIVHDTDIRNVVNELWNAGAVAVSVNGQRMVASSAIRGDSKKTAVNGIVITPPFEIKAIGIPDSLVKALSIRGGLQEQLSVLGMMSVKKEGRIVVPGYDGGSEQ